MDHVYVVIYVYAWTKQECLVPENPKKKQGIQEEENLGMEMGHGDQNSINIGNVARDGQYIH